MIKQIFTYLLNTILIIVILFCAALNIPRLVGIEPVIILSGSMEPDYPVHSVSFIDTEKQAEDIVINNVISYDTSSGAAITHRVVDIDHTKELIYTKGDANDAIDIAPVPFSAFRGKVIFVLPYLGGFLLYLQKPAVIITSAGLIILSILLSQLWKHKESMRKWRKTS